jgi:hypothetical protein
MMKSIVSSRFSCCESESRCSGMTSIHQIVEPLLLHEVNPFDLISDAEKWRTVTSEHLRELMEFSSIDYDSAIILYSHLQQLSSTSRESILNSMLIKSDSNSIYIGDDIMIVVARGINFSDRNPFVSFWSLAVLVSLYEDLYHEAKNYWLSACAAVLHASRRRSIQVRRAYLTALYSTMNSTLEGAHLNVLLLPVAEMLLEIKQETTHDGIVSLNETGIDFSVFLRTALEYAPEPNAVELSQSAFPLLYALSK